MFKIFVNKCITSCPYWEDWGLYSLKTYCHMPISHIYIQPKLDYGLPIYGCTTQENLTVVQRLQNHAVRLILGNFDYIKFGGIELVKSLGLYTIEKRRDYFPATLMFKSIHGLAPTYMCNHVVMNFDVNGYDTRGTDSMNVYLPKLKKDIYKNIFL